LSAGQSAEWWPWLSGELRPANGYECADNRTGHVLQKTIRVEHKNEALGVSDDPQAKRQRHGSRAVQEAARNAEKS
jgi:hypothetical protein